MQRKIDESFEVDEQELLLKMLKEGIQHQLDHATVDDMQLIELEDGSTRYEMRIGSYLRLPGEANEEEEE